MPTCGQCKAREQSIAHIWRCYEAARRGDQLTPIEPGAGAAKVSNGQPRKPKVKAKSRKKTNSRWQAGHNASQNARNKKNGSSKGKQVPSPDSANRARASRVDDFNTTPAGALSAEEFRQKYPSGATKTPAVAPAASEPKYTGRTSRGGDNFREHGMVNPPPSGKPANSSY